MKIVNGAILHLKLVCLAQRRKKNETKKQNLPQNLKAQQSLDTLHDDQQLPTVQRSRFPDEPNLAHGSIQGGRGMKRTRNCEDCGDRFLVEHSPVVPDHPEHQRCHPCSTRYNSKQIYIQLSRIANALEDLIGR